MGRNLGGLLLATVLCSGMAFGSELGVVQETSAGAQVQTVQATGYWGTQQFSGGGQWTLGLDWNRLVTLRGGLVARSVFTSAVVSSTVYPGYVGWGWIAALDWLPLRTQWAESSWAAGATAAGTWEFFEYPGLYRNFTLPGASVALLGEVVPGGTPGLTFRLRIPVSVDQREKFGLSWRVGAELAVVFRGVGWTLP